MLITPKDQWVTVIDLLINDKLQILIKLYL